MVIPASKTLAVPEWLMVMRAMTGTLEAPGSADNPKILAMATKIAEAYPEMKSYCDLYKHDETPWCGLTMAYCMTMAGIRPVFGPTDTDKFLWAQAWDDPSFGTIINEPVLGCVVVMKRSGGGHVTLYESTSGSNYICRGGNQGDSINASSYPKSNVIALVWPKEAAHILPPQPRRELSKGMTGPDVSLLQVSLGIPADGDFGAITEAQAKSFQAAAKLGADGIVGDATWAELDSLDTRKKAGNDGLPNPAVYDAISNAVGASPLINYSWPDRGKAPRAYLDGMALTFALACVDLERGLVRVQEMSQAEQADDQTDALTWYKSKFAAHGMTNTKPGYDTLRHLFVMMIGLGMRESSGKYYEGRDMSATNTTAETCEAGLFQTSWNIRSCSPNIAPLLTEYWNDPNGFLPWFQKGLSPTANGLGSYGTGDGARYQFLAKYSPAFHALVTAIGMRKLRKHWGPINRNEVTINPDADVLLKKVQDIIQAPGPAPEPEPEPGPEMATVDILTTGKVIVTINGVTYGPVA